MIEFTQFPHLHKIHILHGNINGQCCNAFITHPMQGV